MSYHGHICELPFRLRPMGPCPACEYERKMAAASAPMPDDAPEPKPIDLMKVLTNSLARREDAAGERVAQIAARLNAATPGPWRVSKLREPEGFIPDAILCPTDDPEFDERVLAQLNYHFPHAADAQFIAHSRSDMEYLLAALDRGGRQHGADTPEER